MDMRTLLLTLVALVAMVTCTEDSHIKKREVDDVANSLDDEENEMDLDKRHSIFRYGKRAVPIFRYGKRIFRYGKRDFEDDSGLQDIGSYKRLFRWGKRSDSDGAYKRLFRWGKRSGEEDDYSDISPAKRIFRYGKRSDELDDLNEAKRNYFLLGDEKRAMEDAKRIFRYGRSGPGIAIRTNPQPQVPFRFGEE